MLREAPGLGRTQGRGNAGKECWSRPGGSNRQETKTITTDEIGHYIRKAGRMIQMADETGIAEATYWVASLLDAIFDDDDASKMEVAERLQDEWS